MKNKKLGKKLWKLIEATQGFAFISDLVEDWSDEEVLAEAQRALGWIKETIKRLEKFIEENA